ncbi:outer membrane protein transport protein [Aeromonas sp. A-5]|uniref:outer membrane protein transport protein n=1 Tax=Aeromonas ichthyocola TaxID=3367746 RepID=UPI0038E8F016
MNGSVGLSRRPPTTVSASRCRKGYSAGHFGNVSDIKTVELGTALAYQFTPFWSAGMGLSLIHGEGEVGGTFPSNKIAKHLKGDGWAWAGMSAPVLELSPASGPVSVSPIAMTST